MTAITCSQQFSAPKMIGHVDEVSPRLAFVDVRPEQGQDSHRSDGTDAATWTLLDDDDGSAWLATCFQLTSRVERLSSSSAVLDLGPCTKAEAMAALHDLLQYLSSHGLRGRAGIAHSATLAQLALLRADSGTAVACLAPEAAQAFLRDVPVAILTRFHSVGLVAPEVIERLQRYGLRTFGQVARLGELALRRQFGAATGAMLAALARGRDLCPLQPTPRPERLCCRFRFATAASSDQVLAALPSFARRVATHLHQNGTQARVLVLSLHWASGAKQHLRHTLRWHTDDAGILARELRGLLLSTLQVRHPRGNQGSQDADARGPMDLRSAHHGVDELRLTLGDFAPPQPRQITFWQTRKQRVAAAHEVAAALARRHGRSLVLSVREAEPAAIFPEERHRLHALLEPPATATGTEAKRRLAALRHPAPPQGRQGGHQAQEGRGAPDPHDPWRHVPHRLHWW